MSMSTHVVAFRDMDGEFKRMLDAKHYCDEHQLSYPKEVSDYFRGLAGESAALLRDEFLTVDLGGALQPWQEGASEGYEVDVAALPPEVKTIRFYNAW